MSIERTHEIIDKALEDLERGVEFAKNWGDAAAVGQAIAQLVGAKVALLQSEVARELLARELLRQQHARG